MKALSQAVRQGKRQAEAVAGASESRRSNPVHPIWPKEGRWWQNGAAVQYARSLFQCRKSGSQPPLRRAGVSSVNFSALRQLPANDP